MATGRNHFGSAARILAALEGYRSGHESLAVAKVVLMISMREYEMALGYLDGEALRAHPGSAMLRAFRGMVLLGMDRRGDALSDLEEAARSADAPAANLAKCLMERK